MKNYFSFTRSQQLGVLIWLGVILIILTSSVIISNQKPDALFEVNPQDLEYVKLQADNQKREFNDTRVKPFPESREYFYFDPNELDQQGWEKLDFSEKQAAAIISYRNKFGPFKTKEDLKEVYVISSEKYTELAPYIQISPATVGKTEIDRLNLNLASQADLELLPEIGPKFAQKIVRYREALGGFTSLTQLHEVYGMTEDLYQILVENTAPVSGTVVQININTATKDEIDKHPYIDFDVTAAILKERELHKIESLDFLVSKNLLTPEETERLKPYITFE